MFDNFELAIIGVIIICLIAIIYFTRPSRILFEPRHVTIPSEITLDAKTIKEYQDNINSWISRLDKTDEFGQLKPSCNYSIKNGKRFRAIIALEIARINTKKQFFRATTDYSNLALAIEYIHNSSLIIDDMDYFDDDDYRRGELSTHKKFGVAVAHMTALVLLVSAFQAMSRQIDTCDKHDIAAYLNFYINSQLQNTAIGQIQDMTISNIRTVINNKTATLFEIATVCAWLLSGGNKKLISQVKEFGTCFAYVLQLTDDINDMEKDLEIGHTNFANQNGLDKTFEEIKINVDKIGKLASKLELESNIWSELITILMKTI